MYLKTLLIMAIVWLPFVQNNTRVWLYPSEPGIYQLQAYDLSAHARIPGCKYIAMTYTIEPEDVFVASYHGECVNGEATTMLAIHGEATISNLVVEVKMQDESVHRFPFEGEWRFQEYPVRP